MCPGGFFFVHIFGPREVALEFLQDRGAIGLHTSFQAG